MKSYTVSMLVLEKQKFSLEAGVGTVTHGQCVGQEHRKGMALLVKITHVRGF